MKLTLVEYHAAMIAVAKEIQGGNYIGDAYYSEEDGWRDYRDNEMTPREAVIEDMSYWEP